MENKKFKVGDKVYCILNGWGVVVQATAGERYTVNVSFENPSRNFLYMSDGRMRDTDITPILYHQKVNLTEYPKIMEVSVTKSNWYRREVIAKVDAGYVTNHKAALVSWRFARDIQEKEVKELTLKEIAEKFGCSVEDIRIKK